MYNKSLSARNEETVKKAKIKTEDNSQKNLKQFQLRKIFFNENFASNPSKLNDKSKKLETLKTTICQIDKLTTPKNRLKFTEKTNNLNEETLKKIISFNCQSDENSNKNLVNSNEKIKQTNDRTINTGKEKKLKSLNINNQYKITKSKHNVNQYYTINTDTVDNYNYPNLDKVKISHKNFGIIEAYSAITTEGIVRNYNEDRVSIILNVPKPTNYNKNDWPKCSFFGIYDGHGGSNCADFLRDNLHKNIINDINFPSNPQKAILNGFIKSEKKFVEEALKHETKTERSGSCAIILLFIENRCYVANVGDSRAIMSGNEGKKIYCLSRDHKPNDEKEYKRIIEAGGKIYQTEASIKITSDGKTENIIGPLRVIPGKLSVSRAIGDIEAKNPSFGGNPNVVIAIPEIKYFDLNSNYDFIIIGSDGLFEKMKNKEIIDCLWKNFNMNKTKSLHDMSGIIVDNLISKCFDQKSSDNITAVLICLENMKEVYLEKQCGTTEENQPLNTISHFSVLKKNNSLNNKESKQPKLLCINNSSKTEKSSVDKKLILNKIIKNTLRMKSEQKLMTDNYISLNN